MILKNKKCQAAVEFLILFAIALTMLVGFMYFSRGQFDRIEETQIAIDANALGEDLSRYVVFSLRTDYLKVKDFRLPIDIGGREYDAMLAQDVAETYVILNLTDTGNLFYYSLKKKISGEIDKSVTYEHCISAKEGNASIYPFIVGLEPARIKKDAVWKEINSSDFTSGMLAVSTGDEFSFYIKGNCMHDFKQLDADIIFDTTSIEFVEAKESSTHEIIENGAVAEIYGTKFFERDAKANYTSSSLPGRGMQISIIHEMPDIGPIGSDSIIELVFKATAANAERIIEIEPTLFVDGLFRDEIPPGDSFGVKIA